MIKLNENKKDKSQKKILIRKPVVSGIFYSADKKELDDQLNIFFAQTKKINLQGKPQILIVPHAGIIYSGLTAGWGFRQIEGEDYKRVVLLGASHTFWFSYIAVDESDFWETPLGKIGVDQEFISLIADGKKIIKDKNPFLKEHCLELELIFLQKVLKNFKIVPILVSDLDIDLEKLLGKKISDNFNKETLLVISSDLSHYPPYNLAKKADKKTIEAILSGRKDEFEKKIKEVESAGFWGLETAACGKKAIGLGLYVADNLQIKDFKLIHYSNSADFFGDKNRVVGYASIIGFCKSRKANFLTEEEKRLCLKIARETLESYLKKGVIPNFEIKEKGLFLSLGCFITLRKDGRLRGCLGEFESTDPLWKVIQRTAIKSALSDHRFLPVSQKELPEIKIEISIISARKKINDWQEIQLGKQGVFVEGYGRRGIFLPDVALETNWSLEEFLSHLCSEKAGLQENCYKDPEVKIYVFEVQKIKED